MNIALWTMQILLAIVFVLAGLNKLIHPREKLIETQPMVATLPWTLYRSIGGAEILGSIGLILPAMTGILPILTPAAATGLSATMFLAAIMHVRRQERAAIGITLALAVSATFVAWGGFARYLD